MQGPLVFVVQKYQASRLHYIGLAAEQAEVVLVQRNESKSSASSSIQAEGGQHCMSEEF